MTRSTTTLKISRSKLQPGGIDGVLYLLAYPDPRGRSDKKRRADKTERDFEVVGLLSKTTMVAGQPPAAPETLSGSSFFKVDATQPVVRIRCPIGLVHVECNSDGEIGRLAAMIRCRTPIEAFDQFLRGISPFLDFLSFKADTPAVINRIECLDRANSLTAITFTTPYDRQIINVHEGMLFADLLPIYALYREAKNNPSNYYRLLCYFKILDAIFNHVRPESMKRAKSANVPIKTRRERVPNHPELVRFDKQHCGKPIHEIYDSVLRNEYRNAIAHFLVDNSSPLNPSDYMTATKYSNVILLAEQCCRVVIETQEDYCRQLARSTERTAADQQHAE